MLKSCLNKWVELDSVKKGSSVYEYFCPEVKMHHAVGEPAAP